MTEARMQPRIIIEERKIIQIVTLITNALKYCKITEYGNNDTDSDKHSFPIFPTGSRRNQFLFAWIIVQLDH